MKSKCGLCSFIQPIQSEISAVYRIHVSVVFQAELKVNFNRPSHPVEVNFNLLSFSISLHLFHSPPLTKMELMSQFEGTMEGAPELQLINAADLLRSGQDDPTMTLKALQFLRYKATHNEDREAKMKLSILYADGLGKHIHQDQREATMWARSVYDKQLSQALAACACYLMDETTTRCSTNDNDDSSNNDEGVINMASLDTDLDPFSTIGLILLAGERKTTKTAPLSYLAGLLWIKGIGVEHDLQHGIDCLVNAASQGNHKQAAYELGRVYSDRYIHSLKDMRQSLYWYSRALELGDERALCDLAYGYYEGESDDDDGETTRSTSATTGTVIANGKTLPVVVKDDDLAFKYARRGADTKDRYCQYILGHLYMKGRGTTANAQEAIRWLELSAQQGFTEAIEELATVYLRGVGNVGKDYAKAHSICMLGMESNIVFCQAALGDIYRQGWGVDRDYHQAFQYYQTAATHEHPYPYAQHMLGEM